MTRTFQRKICLYKWFIPCSALLIVLYLTLLITSKLTVLKCNQETIVLAEPLRYHEDFKESDKQKETSLNAYIVEEHHEVIPYWFKAANDGKIPRYGNTLIHIDGHSDMAPPGYSRKFPFFIWPNNTDQLKYFMQENDKFILSAAISGLVSKIIWIWPKWDSENHKNSLPFSVKMDIGWTKIKTRIPNLKRQEFCICFANESTNNTDCITQSISYEDVIHIKANDCNIKRSILFEEFQEERAHQLLKKSQLYLGGGGAILDIDEDYYGCTYATQPIRDTGVTVDTILEINDYVSQLFCPRNSKEELESDRVLVEILQHLNNISCTYDGKPMNGKMCTVPRIIKEVRQTFTNKIRKDKTHLICKIDTSNFDKCFEDLLDKLKDLTVQQNTALQFVGFCLTMSPKTLDRFSESRFQICHGSNLKENSVVLVHQPDDLEISWRTRVLARILPSVKMLNPGIVTICRSGRDGYTPRELLNQIENDVLKTLKSTFSDLKIIYDAGLLGGITGWAKRYDLSMDN